jgi:hypothetical protein
MMMKSILLRAYGDVNPRPDPSIRCERRSSSGTVCGNHLLFGSEFFERCFFAITILLVLLVGFRLVIPICARPLLLSGRELHSLLRCESPGSTASVFAAETSYAISKLITISHCPPRVLFEVQN